MAMKNKTKKILIVEDAPLTLQLMAERFSKDGFLVLKAKNGRQGLSIAGKEHPDIILLDIIMPEMDGIAMLKELRADEWGKDVPVIILADIDDTETIASAIENNAYEFLLKNNWRLEEIVEKVKKKLDTIK